VITKPAVRRPPPARTKCTRTGNLTLSNPIFLPTVYSPVLICFRRERGWWITCNYPTVLKDRNRKSTTCITCWVKSVLHEEKCRGTGSDSWRTNSTRTVSDVFPHRSGTGKSYCRARSNVGSERVKNRQNSNQNLVPVNTS